MQWEWHFYLYCHHVVGMALQTLLPSCGRYGISTPTATMWWVYSQMYTYCHHAVHGYVTSTPSAIGMAHVPLVWWVWHFFLYCHMWWIWHRYILLLSQCSGYGTCTFTITMWWGWHLYNYGNHIPWLVRHLYTYCHHVMGMAPVPFSNNVVGMTPLPLLPPCGEYGTSTSTATIWWVRHLYVTVPMQWVLHFSPILVSCGGYGTSTYIMQCIWYFYLSCHHSMDMDPVPLEPPSGGYGTSLYCHHAMCMTPVLALSPCGGYGISSPTITMTIVH